MPNPHVPHSPSIFFGLLSQDAKEEVLKQVAKAASERFKDYRDALREGVALRKLRAADRLDSYRTRAPDIWARLQAQFPQEYNSQMQDWGKLETARTLSRVKRETNSPAAKTSLFDPHPQEA